MIFLHHIITNSLYISDHRLVGQSVRSYLHFTIPVYVMCSYTDGGHGLGFAVKQSESSLCVCVSERLLYSLVTMFISRVLKGSGARTLCVLVPLCLEKNLFNQLKKNFKYTVSDQHKHPKSSWTDSI